MDPMGEEELDYEDEDYGQKKHFQTGGAISALAEEEMMAEDEEYDDLYNDVNIGEGFIQSIHNNDSGGIGTNGVEQAEGMMGQEIDSREVNEGGVIPGVVQKEEEEVEGEGEGEGGGYGEEVGEKPGVDGLKGLEGLEGSNSGHVMRGVLKERVLEGGGGLQGDAKNGDFGGRGSVGSVKGLATGGIGLDAGAISAKGDHPVSAGRGGASSAVANRGSQSRGALNDNAGSRHGGEGGPGSMLFVGELHWWTTDAELESVLSQYGRVKELKFFDEKASGKSKGYCQVEFYDAKAAAACKEGMNGHVFNGRPCVVAHASPHTVRQMGAAQVNKSQQQSQTQTQPPSQQRRIMNDGGGRGGGGSYQSNEGSRNYGKMGWGRGGQNTGSRGQGGQGRARGGGMGGKNMGGSGGGGGGSGGGGHYGQGLPGPPMGGPPGGMMHPQGMMGQGFDPSYGAHMGRGGGYGGFSSHGPPFHGMIPSFPPVGTVGLPGVAPHVNPAFFGRGVTANGMGMMPSGGMEGHQTGMWAESGMGGWGGEDHNRRMRESSYGDDMGSEYGYSDMNHERGGRSSASRDKERVERDWGGSSDRRRRDDRETDWHRDRYREEKDGYMEQRQRDRDWENEDDWEKERPSKSRSKGRIIEDEDQRPRSKEADYGKRRRLQSELNE